MSIARTAAQQIGLNVEATKEYDTMCRLRGIPQRNLSDPSEGNGKVWMFQAGSKTGNGIYIIMTVERLFDAPPDSPGRLVAYQWRGMYVASRIIDHASEEMPTQERKDFKTKVEWREVPKPEVPSSSTQFDVLLAWLSRGKREATVVTHGLYCQGTADNPGHSAAINEVMGQQFSIVGPPVAFRPLAFR